MATANALERAPTLTVTLFGLTAMITKQKYSSIAAEGRSLSHTHKQSILPGQRRLDTRHQRYLSSQHFYTRVALRNSETTSWSKAEGAGFHKKARKVTY